MGPSPPEQTFSARQGAALLGCLLTFVAGRCLQPMDETDLFFNLRLGEVVLQTRSVPRTNLLSFTYPDAVDVNLAWLFQIGLYLVHRAGGIPATVLCKTAFVLATFALLFATARRRGAHPAVAALTLALAAWAAEPRFVERPHLVTFVGLAYLLLALERAEAGRPRALFAVPVLGLAWANANSCFFLAPVALGLYALGAWLEGRQTDARRAALIAALLLPLIFATPAGTGALSYIANHFRMPSLRPLQEYRVAEWPLDGPFFILALLAAGLTMVSWRTLPLRQVLPVLALGCLGARRIRFVAEFALLAGPLVAALATQGLARLRARLPLAPTAAVVLLGLALAPRVSAARAGRPVFDLGVEADLVPTAAIEFVERHALADHLYNDMEVGSYLLWRWRGRHAVFQDPRINGYPAAFHALMKRPDLDPATWQDLLDRHGVRAALLTYPTQNPRAALFDPRRWALLYHGRDGLVFTRREPARRDLIAARELPLTFTATRAGGDTTVSPRVLATPPPGAPLPTCEWRRRLGDHHLASGDHAAAEAAYAQALAAIECLEDPARAAAQQARADLALRRGDPVAAINALIGLDDRRADNTRGFAFLQLGRPGEALTRFDAVLAAPPDDATADALFGRGLALEATGDRAAMAAALRTFLARFPQHVGARAARARLEGGR